MTVSREDARLVVDTLAGATAMVVPALGQWPVAAFVARLVSTALGVATLLLREGASPDEVIASLRRAKRIDTTEEDARADAAIAALPPRSLEPPTLPVPWQEPSDEAD